MIETRWSDFKRFNVKKNYICALVGVLIKLIYTCFIYFQSEVLKIN